MLSLVAVYLLIPAYVQYATFLTVFIALFAIGDVAMHWITGRYFPVLLGCDIGDEGVRFIRLQKIRGIKGDTPYKIAAFGMVASHEVASFRRKHFSAWHTKSIKAACPGVLCLLREIDLPPMSHDDLMSVLDYELAYRFSWFDDSWLTTAAQLPDEEGNRRTQGKYMVTFLKKEEVDARISGVSALGLTAQSVELRATAILRAASPLLPSMGTCLIIEFYTEFIIISGFRGTVLILQHHLPIDSFTHLDRELQITNHAPYGCLIMVNTDGIIRDMNRLNDELQNIGLIDLSTKQITAEQIFSSRFPTADASLIAVAPHYVTALGLALREND